MIDRDTSNVSAMRKVLIALSVCVALAACNHTSGEGDPTTSQQEEIEGGSGGGGGGGY